MIFDYNPKDIEKKWQDLWEKEEAYKTIIDESRPKYYVLVEFPYPSGDGLHVGHTRPYTAMDIIARKRRLEGYNVLFPMGWDAFGLPTENYAIKHKIHPTIVTKKNVERFKNQLKSIGYSFDWTKEINTTDPEYYKWTQWIFLKFYEKGLAYKSEMPINWCTQCKIGLANEEVVNGVCERCGGEVVRKVKKQWMLKITDYAEKLLNDLDEVNFIEKVKTQQRNWIGRSQGAEVKFKLDGKDENIEIFTTRPDTLFGATYMVLSPEHPLIEKYMSDIENIDQVLNYKTTASKKSDFERTELSKEKTGVCLEGIYAINPVNGKKIPIWISDYVLMSYGTGAIMAVPAHDERDFDFAKKFNLPIIEVVKGGNVQEAAFTNVDSGILVNSDFLNGLEVKEAKQTIIKWLEDKRIGKEKVNYKLRDWVFSRQRYWGEPIPLVYCEKCGWVPVPENELPVTLPNVENYVPTENGESPLANIDDWVNTKCPKCGANAKRETDTMPNWAGSSWYFLRYIDPKNKDMFAAKKNIEYYMPVDWYNGGMEHTTLHLLYSRFWHKFLYDLGYVTTKEPYMKRTSHGMILAENNEKMSKSRGNVINPDDIVNELGADTLRTYMMFIGAFDQSAAWSQQGCRGCKRFLDRVWKLQDMIVEGDNYSAELEIKMHQTIKKVSMDFEQMKFNTAIAAMMSLVNDFYAVGKITKSEIKTLLILLNPIAPHITEEIWQNIRFNGRIYNENWPNYDERKTIDNIIELPIQINGKLKTTISIELNSQKDQIRNEIFDNREVKKAIEGKKVIKEIFVQNKIYNIVVK